jgi:putative phosphonate metabolism protein
MEHFKRYAVYFAPRPGDFADAAARWLGRDAASGAALPQPPVPGLDGLTADPRRYGFHGTIRAPFRPAPGQDGAAIAAAVAELAARLQPAMAPGLRLADLHGFLALVPDGDESAILRLGAAVVEGTESLRAPLTDADIARRDPARLTPRQRSLLTRWGYPYVMEEFRFHLTLTNRLPPDRTADVTAAAQAHMAPHLPRPFIVEDLCLFGEDQGGTFHLLHRYALSG